VAVRLPLLLLHLLLCLLLPPRLQKSRRLPSSHLNLLPRVAASAKQPLQLQNLKLRRRLKLQRLQRPRDPPTHSHHRASAVAKQLHQLQRRTALFRLLQLRLLHHPLFQSAVAVAQLLVRAMVVRALLLMLPRALPLPLPVPVLHRIP
jgi:hypothetical protein